MCHIIYVPKMAPPTRLWGVFRFPEAWIGSRVVLSAEHTEQRRAEREQLKWFQDSRTENGSSQGQNMVLTVFVCQVGTTAVA